MSLPRLEHNRFVVSDIDKTIRFYTDFFNFSIAWEGTQPTGERWVHLKCGDMYLSVSQATNAKEIRTIPLKYVNMYGYQHMSWVLDDLTEYRNILLNNSINFTEVGFHIYFFDPDNNEIELISYKN